MLDTIFWIGSYLHLLAIIILLIKVFYSGDCTGISVKSQILYALVFTTRYIDLFTTFISKENTFFKISYIVLTYFTIFSIIFFFRKTYERKHDTARLEILVIPCIVIAVLVNHDSTYMEILWTFSVYLEAVAMVPQFHLVKKAQRIHKHVIGYIIAIAIYEGLYISHWTYQYYYRGYYDNLRLAAGIVQFVLYCDFFLRILPWICTAKNNDVEQPSVVTIEVPQSSGHLRNNVSTIVLTPASLVGMNNDKVNLLTNENTVEKY